MYHNSKKTKTSIGEKMKQTSDEWLEELLQFQLWLVQYTFRSIIDNYKPLTEVVLKNQATKQLILQFQWNVTTTLTQLNR